MRVARPPQFGTDQRQPRDNSVALHTRGLLWVKTRTRPVLDAPHRRALDFKFDAALAQQRAECDEILAQERAERYAALERELLAKIDNELGPVITTLRRELAAALAEIDRLRAAQPAH